MSTANEGESETCSNRRGRTTAGVDVERIGDRGKVSRSLSDASVDLATVGNDYHEHDQFLVPGVHADNGS